MQSGERPDFHPSDLEKQVDWAAPTKLLAVALPCGRSLDDLGPGNRSCKEPHLSTDDNAKFAHSVRLDHFRGW